MVLFVQIVLGRYFAGPVRRRTLLGLGGVCCVLAAGLAAYGLNSGFGEARHIPCTPRNENPWVLNVDLQVLRDCRNKFVHR